MVPLILSDKVFISINIHMYGSNKWYFIYFQISKRDSLLAILSKVPLDIFSISSKIEHLSKFLETTHEYFIIKCFAYTTKKRGLPVSAIDFSWPPLSIL